MNREYGAIFDVDGVLVDSVDAHYEAWCLLAAELGEPHPRELFDRTFGMHNAQILPLWLGSELGAADLKRLSERKESLYRDVAREKLRPLPGAREIVRTLDGEGFLLAVGSSAPRANVDLVLELLGLRGLFAAFSTGEDVRRGKPHPEVFLLAAERLGLPPERCAVLEDAPQGVEAARAAGSRVIAVASTRPEEELTAADRVVQSLVELDPAGLRGLVDGARTDGARGGP